VQSLVILYESSDFHSKGYILEKELTKFSFGDIQDKSFYSSEKNILVNCEDKQLVRKSHFIKSKLSGYIRYKFADFNSFRKKLDKTRKFYVNFSENPRLQANVSAIIKILRAFRTSVFSIDLESKVQSMHVRMSVQCISLQFSMQDTQVV